MKRIIIFTICAFNVICLSAQIKYNVIGFAGKDTLELGVVSPDASGNIAISLKNYTGAVRLVPANAEFQSISKHLDQVSKINSEASFSAAKAYVSDTLDFNALYTSGVWKDYVQSWVGFYAQSTKSPEEFATLFVPVAKQVLNRTVEGHPEIASALSKNLIEFFEQFGLDKAAENIAAYAFGLNFPMGESNSIASRLLTASKLTGNPAPALVGVSADLQNASTLLMFYESGCSNCELQIGELKKHYTELQQKGIRVVAISADEDMNVFNYHSKEFPWKDNLCDLKGFEGTNFINYGVASTPTIYVVDANGIIKGRYAKLSDTGLLGKD